MIHGHGGNIYAIAAALGCDAADIVDMSSNINPLGMPPGMLTAIKAALDAAGVLPEVDGRVMINGLADLLDLDAKRMIAGNGTTQFIYNTCPALKCKKVLIIGPTYADYADACRMYGIEPQFFILDYRQQFQMDWQRFDQALAEAGYDTVFICNANNPTGGLLDGVVLQQFCKSHPNVRFIIDESYMPFVPATDAASLMASELENVSVLWSASKIFGMPGLRAGFLIAPDAVRAAFEHFMQPWCVNSLAQTAIRHLAAQKKATLDFIQNTQNYLVKERQLFQKRLAVCPQIQIYSSVTSYLLIQLPLATTAQMVCDRLTRYRFLIRNCSNFYGLSDRFVRVALKSSEINQKAVILLAAAINDDAIKAMADFAIRTYRDHLLDVDD